MPTRVIGMGLPDVAYTGYDSGVGAAGEGIANLITLGDRRRRAQADFDQQQRQAAEGRQINLINMQLANKRLNAFDEDRTIDKTQRETENALAQQEFALRKQEAERHIESDRIIAAKTTSDIKRAEEESKEKADYNRFKAVAEGFKSPPLIKKTSFSEFAPIAPTVTETPDPEFDTAVQTRDVNREIRRLHANNLAGRAQSTQEDTAYRRMNDARDTVAMAWLAGEYDKLPDDSVIKLYASKEEYIKGNLAAIKVKMWPEFNRQAKQLIENQLAIGTGNNEVNPLFQHKLFDPIAGQDKDSNDNTLGY